MIGLTGRKSQADDYAITPIAFRASYIENVELDNGGFLDVYL